MAIRTNWLCSSEFIQRYIEALKSARDHSPLQEPVNAGEGVGCGPGVLSGWPMAGPSPGFVVSLISNSNWRNTMLRLIRPLALACALLSPAALLAQFGSGTILGTVTDPTGAVVPNA